MPKKKDGGWKKKHGLKKRDHAYFLWLRSSRHFWLCGNPRFKRYVVHWYDHVFMSPAQKKLIHEVLGIEMFILDRLNMRFSIEILDDEEVE
jgi:uncharacterized membrane protein YbaN (DUF454 family)